MNYIEEYANKIISGEIIACHRIKQVYTMLLDKLQNEENYYPWVFDEEVGNRPIEFIEKFCKQAQGTQGTPIELMLFQKAKLQAIFGFVHAVTGERQYQEVLDIRGRKNGKTTELSATGLYTTIADGEGSPETYWIATKLDQSKKGFDECLKMVKQSPLLKKYLRKRQADLYCDLNFGIIKPLASNSNSLDGLNAHLVVIDELAAIKNRDIYDLMKQSMSSRKQPLLTCITTNGFVRESIFDSQYEYACNILDGKATDLRFLPFIYELDSRDEWDKEEYWIKANPGLDVIKSRDFLRDCVSKAKNDPSFKPTVMVKDFNLKENSASAWLNWNTLENKVKFNVDDMNFKYCIGGFDGAETTDLMAAKVLCMKPNDDHVYVLQMYWLPEETLIQRQELDKIPYQLWERQGLLRVVPGNRCTFDYALEWFKELRDEKDIYVYSIGYDPWHMDQSMLQRFESEFGKQAMIPVRQGVVTLSTPMKKLAADLGANKIIYNDNVIDKWCLSNTEIKADINGNIQPIKGMDSRKRIDGTVALINAYVILQDKLDEFQSIV